MNRSMLRGFEGQTFVFFLLFFIVFFCLVAIVKVEEFIEGKLNVFGSMLIIMIK